MPAPLISDCVANVYWSEGDLLHESKLHSHLAHLAAGVELRYTAPTDAENAVAEQLIGDAQQGERRLEAIMASAGRR